MHDCNCTDIKQIIMCELNRGEGPCINEAPQAEPTPTATHEPPALNSDALTNNLVAALGDATVVTEL